MLAHFEFVNFAPSDDLEVEANLALFKSADYISYSERPRAVLKKAKDHYKCILMSQAGASRKIYKEVKAKSAHRALKLLLNQIRSKISLV